MKTHSVKVNATLNIIKTLFSLIFPLITFPYASRVLGPSGTGKVHFAQSIISYFTMIASLGIGTYGIREAAKVRDDRTVLTKFVKEVFSINLISTVFAYFLLFASLFLVPKFEEYRNILIVCSSTILFTTLGMDWLYSAKEEYFYITIRSIVFQFLSAVLLFTLVRKSDDILQYAAVSVVSSVGSNILNFFHARKFLDLKVKITLELKKHLKPIFTLFAMSVAVSIYTVLDSTMVGFIKDDAEVGFYNAATKINKLVLTLVNSVGTVLLPRLSYYAELKDKSSFGNLTQKGMNFLLILALPCAAGLGVLSKQIILLFSGEQFLPALNAMRIMNPIILIVSLSGLIGIQIFMPLRKEKLTLISVICGCIVNVIFNSILIPKYGATGAAIATLIAESVVTLIQLILARKYFDWKKITIHFVQCLIATIFMSFAVYFISSKFESNFASVLCGILIGILSYIFVLFIFRNKFLLGILKSVFKRRRS